MVVATIGKILSGPSIRKVRFEKLPTGKPPGGFSAQYVVKFYVQKAIFPEIPPGVTNGGRRRAVLRDGRSDVKVKGHNVCVGLICSRL